MYGKVGFVMGCLESNVHTEIVICFPPRECDCMLRECHLTLVIYLQNHSVLTAPADFGHLLAGSFSAYSAG